MRIYLKKKLLDLTASMEEAEEIAKGHCENRRLEEMRGLLYELKQSADAVRETVEGIEGEETGCVGYLDEYGGLLRKALCACDRKELYNSYKKLRRKRLQIRNAICYELPDDKLELVFLPYKADMWPSLASIWNSARKDTDCNVYVVPSPYFDIGDPNRVRLLYDGRRYPPEVPVIDYRSFPLEELHPDMIFIHNPYDDQNNLTRLPERFFTGNLKKHTELLVYSPYFTVGTYEAGKQDFLFLSPGARQADYVAVQSAQVKNLFERYGYEADRLLDYGSPKIDSIVEMNRRRVRVPLEWEEKIKGRKVFLLNTHLSYFPKSDTNQKPSGNYAVRFHQEIMDAFLGRDDCALIWRPHPLLKNMLEDRFPQCLEFVNEFERRVEEAGNGIVDRLGDYTVSFSCSHAMLSTWSSLINEYMVTGKPVLIFQRRMGARQALEAPLNRNKNYFRFGKDGITFERFRDQILQGEDPLYEERMKAVNEAFPNLDGNAGEKIFRKLKITYETQGGNTCRR